MSDKPKVMEQPAVKDLKFKLSPEEKNKMADQAAEISAERNQLAATFAESNKATRAVLKDKQREIDRLLACHKHGVEVRETKVTERYDWEKGIVEIILDNKVFESRKMTEDESQMRLDENPGRVIKGGKKEKKPTRAEKNPEKHMTPEELKSREIAAVHREETGRSSKRSSVDKNA